MSSGSFYLNIKSNVTNHLIAFAGLLPSVRGFLQDTSFIYVIIFLSFMQCSEHYAVKLSLLFCLRLPLLYSEGLLLTTHCLITIWLTSTNDVQHNFVQTPIMWPALYTFLILSSNPTPPCSAYTCRLCNNIITIYKYILSCTHLGEYDSSLRLRIHILAQKEAYPFYMEVQCQDALH